MTQYNVILYKDNHSFESYNILPVFRNVWNSKSYNFKKVEVKTVPNLKEWILNVSRYYFRAKCEYEFLIASWPFGSKQMYESLQSFFYDNEKNSLNKDLSDYSTRIDLDNIITNDMYKIDIYQQIKMNIDIIVSILAKEFNIK
jgi:hypothetical protein